MADISDPVLVEAIVNTINTRVDIPWVGEEAEESVIRPVVEMIAPSIPQSIRPTFLDAEDGLDDAEVNRNTDLVVGLVSQQILSSVPGFIRPFLEGRVRSYIRPHVEWVFKFAQKGLALAS